MSLGPRVIANLDWAQVELELSILLARKRSSYTLEIFPLIPPNRIFVACLRSTERFRTVSCLPIVTLARFVAFASLPCLLQMRRLLAIK
jgi:hypothetical protein